MDIDEGAFPRKERNPDPDIVIALVNIRNSVASLAITLSGWSGVRSGSQEIRRWSAGQTKI